MYDHLTSMVSPILPQRRHSSPANKEHITSRKSSQRVKYLKLASHFSQKAEIG